MSDQPAKKPALVEAADAANAAYRLETLHFESPRLPSVPVAYLITMTTSTRRASYMAQLARHRPTARVVVVHNAGYVACPKPGVSSPAQDIFHATRFAVARSPDAEFVLVLEDDVEFTDEFPRRAAEIDRFLRARRGEEFVYSLGLQAFASMPVAPHHVRVLSGGYAHGVVYSRAAGAALPRLRMPSWGLHDILVYTWFRTYAPRRACAVQPYERTANARRWDRLGIARALSAACGDDARRLYALHDEVNARGGAVVVALAVALAARAVAPCGARGCG